MSATEVVTVMKVPPSVEEETVPSDPLEDEELVVVVESSESLDDERLELLDRPDELLDRPDELLLESPDDPLAVVVEEEDDEDASTSMPAMAMIPADAATEASLAVSAASMASFASS